MMLTLRVRCRAVRARAADERLRKLGKDEVFVPPVFFIVSRLLLPVLSISNFSPLERDFSVSFSPAIPSHSETLHLHQLLNPKSCAYMHHGNVHEA